MGVLAAVVLIGVMVSSVWFTFSLKVAFVIV